MFLRHGKEILIFPVLGVRRRVWMSLAWTVPCIALVKLILLSAVSPRADLKYKRENVFENNKTYCSICVGYLGTFKHRRHKYLP